MLHNIPINWITCALSQTSILYYSVYFAALCVNLHPVNITSNIVPVVATITIRYKSTSEKHANKMVVSVDYDTICLYQRDNTELEVFHTHAITISI